jgi:hypothetical protein
MLPDCPLCDSQMHLRPDGLSLPAIECSDCSERFDDASDLVNFTPLRHIRRKSRRIRLRLGLLKCRIMLSYYALEVRVITARIRFWEYVGATAGEPTPEHSERLTGIEVSDRDE